MDYEDLKETIITVLGLSFACICSILFLALLGIR